MIVVLTSNVTDMIVPELISVPTVPSTRILLQGLMWIAIIGDMHSLQSSGLDQVFMKEAHIFSNAQSSSILVGVMDQAPTRLQRGFHTEFCWSTLPYPVVG
jgi:hypothetical protein